MKSLESLPEERLDELLKNAAHDLAEANAHSKTGMHDPRVEHRRATIPGSAHRIVAELTRC